MKFLKIHKSFKFEGKSHLSAASLIETIRPISNESACFLEEWFNDSLFVVVQTSGSTGAPKKIKLKKEYLFNSAKATGEYFQIKENTKALHCLSSAYIAGKMMWVRALTLGWHLDLVSVDANPLGKNTNHYDFTAMVPLQVSNSLDQLYRIKKIIIGGGVVSEKLQNDLKNMHTQAFATYGMTETVTHIAIKKLNNFKEENDASYEILPSIEISLDDRECLVIDAPFLSDEKVVTNDLVKIISSTKFLWLGRFDSIINSGGVKLIPEKIEKKINKMVTAPFFITSKKDELLGEKVILVIEGNNESMLEKDKIISFLRGIDLALYEIPKEIHFVANFVMTATGKIKRAETLKKIF